MAVGSVFVPGDNMNYYYFIDTSTYNEHTLADLLLLKKMGVRHVIIRAGVAHSEDDRLPTWVELCNQAGLTYSLYFYFYPGLLARSQVELFIVLINEHPAARSIWIDIEEHANPITKTEYSPDTLNGFYKTVFTMVKAAFPDRIVGNYSGGWVLDKYIPKAWQWINAAPYWNASYIKYYFWWHDYLARFGGTWDSDAGQITIEKLPAIMEEISKHWLPGPIGVTKVHAWQAITYIPFQELIHGTNDWLAHLDFNLIRADDWLFGDLLPEGEIPMPEITNAQTTVNLNVRSTPSTGGTILQTLPTETRINVTGTVLAGIWWSKIDYPLVGYVANSYVLHDPVVIQPPLPPINNVEDVIDALEKVKVYIDSLIAELGQ